MRLILGALLLSCVAALAAVAIWAPSALERFGALVLQVMGYGGVAGAGSYAVGRGIAKGFGRPPAEDRRPRNGLDTRLLPALLVCAVASGGCGLDWGRVLGESTFILQTGAQAGQMAGGMIGVSCEAVCEYGSAGDCAACRKIETGVLRAATSAGAAAAGGLIGGLMIRNSAQVSIPDMGPVQVMAMTPLHQVASTCAAPAPADGATRRPIGFQPREP